MTECIFTLEHVTNGFILSTKSIKEVVTEDKIAQRIGEILNIAGLKQSKGACVFRVESCTQENDEIYNSPVKEGIMKAKKKFYNFNKPENGTLAFLIKDDNGESHFEFIDKDADEISTQIGVKVGEKDGVHILKLDVRKETRKLIAKFKPRVVEMTEDAIMEWYNRSNAPM